MIAPTTVGPRDSVAIGAPFGRVPAGELGDIQGREMVVLHRLGGPKDREKMGPRELREATCTSFEKTAWPERWGLGGVCVELEDAANFGIAGYTWFTFDLSSRVDASANGASLDRLDARIVALEDAGVFRQGWHEEYLSGDAATAFDEESLARAAVKFGDALAHAEQLQQTLRTVMTGRGDLPDVEVSIARTLRRTTALELRFVAAELKRRSAWTTAFAPALGPEFQPGLSGTSAPEVAGFADILAATGGVRLAAPGASHSDQSDRAFFAMLRHLAETDPGLFRSILLVAKDAFPLARAGWNLSVTEEDAQMMPEVDDAALAGTFLDHPHGRQILLCTWDAVCEPLGDRIRASL